MKNIFILLLISLFISNTMILANDSYNVYNYDKYTPDDLNQDEKILFIMDYSNSMNEFIGNSRKIELMQDTIKNIVHSINPNTEIGLRVYGYRLGFTPYECCRASKLVVPIYSNNAINISDAIYKTKARGMTPITYSLKKAVEKDFVGFSGKKHIILLSDGGENCDESPCEYVMKNLARRKDFTVDVIAFNINNHEDINQLRCVSAVTSGKFYTANTKGELINALNNTLQITKDVGGFIVEH